MISRRPLLKVSNAPCKHGSRSLISAAFPAFHPGVPRRQASVRKCVPTNVLGTMRDLHRGGHVHRGRQPRKRIRPPFVAAVQRREYQSTILSSRQVHRCARAERIMADFPSKPLGIKNYGHIRHLPGSRMGPGDHHCDNGQARIATEALRDRHDLVIVLEKRPRWRFHHSRRSPSRRPPEHR